MGIWLITAGLFIILEALISLQWSDNDNSLLAQAARSARVLVGTSVVVGGALWLVAP